MSYSHKAVIQNFVNGGRDRKGGNIFSVGNVLYSYGYHFPLLVRTTDGKRIMNADKYSVSTSNHQRLAIRTADVSFPFSAFQGLCRQYKLFAHPYDNPEKFFNNMTIIDKTEPRIDIINYYIVNAMTEKKEYISIHEYTQLLPRDKEIYSRNEEGRPGATLFKLQEIPDTLFLASMDQNQFYIVELKDTTAQTVEEAFAQLKPQYLQDNPDIPYARQGEWFFIDITQYLHPDIPKLCWKQWNKQQALPNPNHGNDHIPTRSEIFSYLGRNPPSVLDGIPADTPVVMGIVRHTQHRALKLEKDHIYIALRNTAVNSWSAQGSVD